MAAVTAESSHSDLQAGDRQTDLGTVRVFGNLTPGMAEPCGCFLRNLHVVSYIQQVAHQEHPQYSPTPPQSHLPLSLSLPTASECKVAATLGILQAHLTLTVTHGFCQVPIYTQGTI